MKRCNRCGAENNDKSNFCSSCGADLSNHKSVKNSDKNLIERFRDTNMFAKAIIIIVVVFVFLMVVGWIGHIFFGMSLALFTEDEVTTHQSEFDSLDFDGNGALSFNEIISMASDIPQENLTEIFNSADKNGNGLLIGGEFDGFIHGVDRYYNDFADLEAHKEAEQQKASSSSSASNHNLNYEGQETCPICGGNKFTEFYNEEYGEMDWECDECGEIFRSDDEVYPDSVASRCILPLMGSNLAIA